MIARIASLMDALLPGRFAEFVRFALVGGLNTSVDFTVYVVLTRKIDFFGVHLVSAATVAFCCAVTVSYLLNSLWTFRRSVDDWRMRAPRFVAVAIGGLLVNAGVLALLVHLGIHDIFAKLAASAASIAWNFPMHRKWTFGK
jgi:putative flippase GtrA